MQDNMQPEFNEQYVDQAWQHMKSLLDEDMPATAVPFWRKRWFLLLTLLVALLGSGLASQYIWGIRSAEPRAVAISHFRIDFQGAAATVAEAEPGPDSPAAAEETVVTSNIETNPAEAQKYSSRIPMSAAVPSNDMPTATSSSISAEPEQQPVTALAPSSRLSEAGFDLAEQAGLSSFAALPGIAPALPLWQPAIEGLSLSHGIQPAKSGLAGKIRKYAEAGFMIWPGNAGMNGLDASLGLDYRPAGSKLSIQAGLGYQYANLSKRLWNGGNEQDAGLALNFAEGMNSDFEFIDDMTNLANLQENVTLIERRRVWSRLHFISIPIRFQFQLASNLQVFAGTRTLFLLGTSGENMQTRERNILYDSSFSSSRTYYSDVQEDIPSRWDLQFSGGLSYHIRPDMALSLSYSRGLTDMPRPDNEAAPLQGLRLGVQYTWQ